jgi:hypothetical protein
VGVLGRHDARVWDVSSTLDGRIVASASGDGTVKVRGVLFLPLFFFFLLIHARLAVGCCAESGDGWECWECGVSLSRDV